MAAPMRDGSSGGNQPTTAANFEYDDNEWDIGIGDLIIDLDADIEKTGVGEGSMAAPKPGKMHSPVEHQATVDKGLKMKIKRTKPGTKHEIVKSGENGEKHSNSAKRGSSGHKRDKKHGDKPNQKDVNGVVRCVERVVYPVTPPVKEKDPQGSGMKKVKSGIGTSGCVAATSGSANSSAVIQCSTGSTASTIQQQATGSGTTPSTAALPPPSLPLQSVTPQSSSAAPLLQMQALPQQQTTTPQQPTPPQQPQPQPPQLQPLPTLQPTSAPQSQSQSLPLQPTQPATLPPSQLQSVPTAQSQSPALQPPPLQHSSSSQLPSNPSSLTPQNSIPASTTPAVALSPPPLQLQVMPNANQQPSPPSTPTPSSHLSKDLTDMCVGTSVGTITEPDCLGPCEPGTSVTLEGIVWHETEGVLVVNVTWRGKTYVGTLLDCTRHDWAPPRFCDSPTSDMDARTPKGRGKRGRNSANSTMNDLSNFTETRSSVHSKLRSNSTNGSKGRRGPGAASPTPFAAPKSDITPAKRKTKAADEEPAPKKKMPQSAPSSPLPPPALLECPEPNCSKKYKHINGLKYHQSHAHGCPDDDEAKESGTSEEEVPSPMPEMKKEESSDVPVVNTEESSLPELEEKPSATSFNEEPTPPPPLIEQPSTVPVAIAIPPTRAPTPPAPSPPPPDESAPLSLASQPPVLTKVPQFKVKPASVLMPDDKKCVASPGCPKSTPNHKKKNRKSPAGSPHPSPLEPPALGVEAGREEVQSPAYSDISDDSAPLLESEVEGKPKPCSDKKEESPQLQHFNIYPYYGQPPYLVPSVSEKPKDLPTDKIETKPVEKEKKEGSGDYQPKMLPQHYYQYGYHVPGYSYNVDGYPAASVVIDDKKEEKAPPQPENKTVNNNALHIPNPTKLKSDSGITKEKLQNESHQILKESIEMKNQVNSSLFYHRQPTQPTADDSRRFYLYPDRKDSSSTKATPPPAKVLPSPSPKHKDKAEEKKERREEEKKHEGVKPTMETQGPPPPPTSQYAYIHPGYMQTPHYGTLPFEPVYRGMNPMLVSGYPNSPYLHPQLHAVPRYAPEDLSRSQSGKALDLLQHHASQYYTPSHKIHELQERAIKSPTPKTTPATSSPSSVGGGPAPPPVTSSAAVQVQGKPGASDNKDSRSPPPQRHVHTHHHTHVGLGYPILAGQYPAPYGAAVLATEHAAAVTSVPYQAK